MRYELKSWITRVTFASVATSGSKVSTSGVKSFSCFFTSAMVNGEDGRLGMHARRVIRPWDIYSRIVDAFCLCPQVTHNFNRDRAAKGHTMDLASLRAEIKVWERVFKAEHQRNPTIDDIKSLPKIGQSLPGTCCPVSCSSQSRIQLLSTNFTRKSQRRRPRFRLKGKRTVFCLRPRHVAQLHYLVLRHYCPSRVP